MQNETMNTWVKGVVGSELPRVNHQKGPKRGISYANEICKDRKNAGAYYLC